MTEDEKKLLAIVNYIIKHMKYINWEEFKSLVRDDVYNLIFLILEDKDESLGLLDNTIKKIYYNITSLNHVEQFEDMMCEYSTLAASDFLTNQYGRFYQEARKGVVKYKYQFFSEDEEFQKSVHKGLATGGYITRLYERLSVRKRVLFQLYCMADCSVDDIAKFLGADNKMLAYKIGQLKETVIKFQ